MKGILYYSLNSLYAQMFSTNYVRLRFNSAIFPDEAFVYVMPIPQVQEDLAQRWLLKSLQIRLYENGKSTNGLKIGLSKPEKSIFSPSID